MSKLRFSVILLLLSTLFLKFSSMIRDLVISSLYGDSYMADAYFASMTIPNAIILFMLTGMKDAFLPSYYKFDKIGKGFSHLTNVIKGTFIFSVVIAIVGTIASPLLVKWLYPEFSHYKHGFSIAQWTIALYFLSVVFVGINAVYEGYFDAKRKFSFSTFSQTIVVLATVIFALLFHRLWGIYSVPIGYLVGTILSFLLKVVIVSPKGLLLWNQRIDWKEIKAFYLIFLPVGITIAVGQINLSVNMLFAARMGEGVVSNLNYAFRLVSIPQAIFGVTIATIIFPVLAQAKTEQNHALFKRGMERGLSTMVLLLAPTITGMILLIEPIIRIVYERGAFSESSTSLTSHYALFYMGSVFFYSIQAVVAKGFYTLEKGHYIMRIGILSIVFNIITNYLLSKLMGPSGLALSASIVGFFYSAVTFSTLYKISGGFNLRYIGKEFGKIGLATLIMVLLLIFLDFDIGISKWGDIPNLLIKTLIGGALYFIGLFVFQSSTLIDLLARNKKVQEELD
jgi:putative peptidoglycan lipid II flippase